MLQVCNSAFCLVQKPKPIENIVTNTANTTTLTSTFTTTSTANNTSISAAKRNTRNTNAVKPQATVTQTNSYSVYNRNKSKEKIMCNILLEKTKREKMLLQEKEDYELAKMLQEYDNDGIPLSNLADTNAANSNNSAATINLSSINLCRTRRYFLRSRSKQNAAPTVAAAPAATASATKASKSSTHITNGCTLTNGKGTKVILNGKVTKAITRSVGKRKKIQ